MTVAQAADAPIESADSVGLPGTAGRSLAETQRDLLVRLAEPGVDLIAARATFLERRGRRRTTRRALGATAAVLVLSIGGLLAVLGGDNDPDAILADGDDSATTTSAPTTTLLAAGGVLLASPVAPPSTLAITTTVAAPVTTPASVDTAPPTTVAPNQQLSASLVLLTPTVEAGAVASLRVDWSDADMGQGSIAPRYIVTWGDPLVSSAIDTTTTSPCEAPGAPASGSDTLRFRYSTPSVDGPYRVSVVLETCDGRGAYSERVELTAEIIVEPPVFLDPADPGATGTPGRPVVVFQPPVFGGVAWPLLERSIAEYVPADAPGTPIRLAGGSPVAIYTTSGPATVLVLPADAAGAIRLRWTDPGSCASTTGADLLGGNGGVRSLPLSGVAC